MSTENISFDELARRYCETQEYEPSKLRLRLREICREYRPQGFVLLRCIVMDSSRFGQRSILPFGGDATLKEVPERPFSPRGLASDISEVEAVLPAHEVPDCVG